MAVLEGWKGRFYEDFEVGDVYRHPLGRTVTTTDNIWFTLLTQNTAPIHFYHHYAAQTEFGKPLVDSTFTVETAGYNQNAEVVITFKRTILVYKHGHASQTVRLNPGEDE